MPTYARIAAGVIFYDSTSLNSTTPLSTLDQDGGAVYEKQLKATLEPQHSGEFVAIEPSRGRYFLGETATTALVAARTAMRESLFSSHA